MGSIYRKLLNSIGYKVLKNGTKQNSFTIFSNDCYGAEIYKALRTPYQTPFVGLMLMAPCYIKFLKNPKYYLSLDLQFTDVSKYEDCDALHATKKYPIAVLDDIEIHFLHYKSSKEAIEKWTSRKERIQWEHIRVNFTIDKDYGTEIHLKEFHSLPYEHKVSFSKKTYPEYSDNFTIQNFQSNALALFRESLTAFNLTGWLNGGSLKLRNWSDTIRANVLKFTVNR
ncbi:DUF1919 domain-containing protein [Polluticaenibacter yanchengensis]|uniref:DUF1919 domain-containing protein n=1 Tax=Polluticaenibacter yanchengensis TaxID=3014562 RepID=A0ABT4UH83_9BACT|nr:DUF1919 domain-containing protein [Chitinophagaceae bacterium LY-5]